jgi:hypothetical protein
MTQRRLTPEEREEAFERREFLKWQRLLVKQYNAWQRELARAERS